jgi:hypothetical protein
LSNWYSGATLLTLLLDRHPEIVSTGETFIGLGTEQDTPCSCGAKVRDCSFLADAAGHMRHGDRFDLDRFRMLPVFSGNRLINRALSNNRFSGRLRNSLVDAVPAFRRRRDRFVTDHMGFMSRAASLARASVFLDATKNIRRAELFLERAEAPIPVIHLVRDARGFAKSLLVEPTEQSRHPDARQAGDRWNEYIDAFDRLRSGYPEHRYLEMRYEDLCHQPAGVLAEALDFLGVDRRDLTSSAGSVSHVLGNTMRLEFRGEIRQDLSWKTVLREEQVATVSDRCRPSMRRYGYL